LRLCDVRHGDSMQTVQPIQQVIFHRQPGEPVQNLALFERAWDECIELQVSPKEVWVGRSLIALSALERFEVAAVHGSEVVGAIVLARDPWDVHVGPCMSVFAQYVLPEYRNAGVSPRMMREALRIARDSRVDVLAFTHRKAPWRYQTIYRRIKHESTEN
jgi:GNAT superfamily N-acetyltransferase